VVAKLVIDGVDMIFLAKHTSGSAETALIRMRQMPGHAAVWHAMPASSHAQLQAAALACVSRVLSNTLYASVLHYVAARLALTGLMLKAWALI
jgi:hypothetical protein